MRTFLSRLTLLLCLLLVATWAASCGESNTKQKSSHNNLPLIDDDDNDDNDDNDDSSPDDDDDNDDNDDDNDDNDTYSSLTCALPDPMSLGAGKLIGGGSPTTQIDVYVYDDGTCAALVGAKVLYNGTVYTADNDGHVVLPLSKAAQTVTAWAANSWAWTYKADAAVMYFRLRPDNYGRTYADSAAGDFTQEGTPIPVTNPDMSTLFTKPLYAGLAAPGLSRHEILSFDAPAGLLATGTWDMTLTYGGNELDYTVDDNIYLPTLNLTVPNVFTVSGGNNHFALPVLSGATTWPIEGVVASLDVSKVFTSLPELLTLVTCLTGGGSLVQCLAPYISTAVNDALGVAYVGADPVWNGAGAPELEMVTPQHTLPLNVANSVSGYDYLGIIAADVPHRALVPIGLSMAESGVGALDYVEVTDAAYITGLLATDLLASDLTKAHFSAAIKYTTMLSDWTAGVSFDAAADFLPWFDDANTSYNGATGEVSWTLGTGGALSPDLYMLAYIPACHGCKVIFAQVPGTDTSYQVPTSEMKITPSSNDIVLLFGFKLPAGVDINAYDPVGVLGYDLAAVNFWTNYDILSLLP